MTNPITPPPELVRQWCDPRVTKSMHFSEQDLATRAAQWGADQELEACLIEASFFASRSLADRIRAARRPKPPSLKAQALVMLENAWEGGHINNNAAQTIRRALESIDD